MEVDGVVRNGIIVPDSDESLPEGTRVHITVASPAGFQHALRGTSERATRPVASPSPDKSFGERFAQFKGAVSDLPTDLADQHDHYRLH